MKSLLSYFIEFQDNCTILYKENLKEYKMNKPNQRLIIIIIYN